MKSIIISRVNTEEQKEVNDSLPSQLVRLAKLELEDDFEPIFI